MSLNILEINILKICHLDNGNINLLYKPNKKFEIFTLDTLGGKTFLTETTNLLEGGENESLNNELSEYNDKIRDLSKKLKAALDRIEFLQKPQTFFEKLKNLFRRDKKF